MRPIPFLYISARWSGDRNGLQSRTGQTINTILSVLEDLDSYIFEKTDANNGLDGLYNRLFSQIPNKEGVASSGGIHSGTSYANEIVSKDASTVHTLCEWATTSKRSGAHRSFVVAKLLERRHLDIAYMMAEAESHHNALYHQQGVAHSNPDNSDFKEGNNSAPIFEQPSVEDIAQQILTNGPPIFQNQLFLYLDSSAPTLESEKFEEFSNLVLLFFELICHDVFSHDHYLRALISRGDINGPITNTKNQNSNGYDKYEEYIENIAERYQDDDSDDESGNDSDESNSDRSRKSKKKRDENDGDGSFDDNKINDDLTNLLNQIKEGNQLGDNHDGHGPFSPPGHASTNNKGNSSENKDNREKKHDNSQHEKTGSNQYGAGQNSNGGKQDCITSLLGVDIAKCSRHWQYVYHFPLPQEDSVATNHDMNQRHVLLYGVGKGKDEISKYVKKLLREIIKLFSKTKYAMDVSDGGKVKKHSKSEFNFTHILAQTKALSYHDQLSVTHTCGQAVLEMLTAFAHGVGSNVNYLPVPEYISFLFDLAGMSLNIQEILDWCLQILKELPAIELQLMERSSGLTRTYTTTLALYCVGVLRKYHKVFILNPPQEVLQIFEVLGKIAYKPKLPSPIGQSGAPSIMLDCNSAEWCILAYLYELSNNCSFVKESARDKFVELKRLFSAPLDPSISIYQHTDERFIIDYIANPKKKIDPLIIKLLIENQQNQYNLVCNVLMEVCECNDTDKLNDIAILCCEFTAQCNALSSEWLDALAALCYSGSQRTYHALLTKVSAADYSIYNRLGIFVSILVARHCLQLQSFGLSVAIGSLLKAWEEVKEGNGVVKETEMGARLSCHLLLKLFKTVEPDFQEHSMFYSVGSPSPMPRPSVHSSGIKYSCDRQLLSSAHRNITVGAIIAILKAILVLGDATDFDNIDEHTRDEEEDLYINAPSPSELSMETASLSDFAKYTLRHICRQEWVRDRCLQVPDDLLRKGILLDQMLSSKQAQKLLRLICAPSYLSKNFKKLMPSSTNASRSSNSNAYDHDLGVDSDMTKSIDEEQRHSISRILTSMDEWNLRVSALEIKLMYNQLQSSQQSPGSYNWLENAATAIVGMFQLVESNPTDDLSQQTKSAKKEDKQIDDPSEASDKLLLASKSKKFRSLWMIPYLVKNLRFLQTKVLKTSCHHLEQGNWSRGPISKASARHAQHFPEEESETSAMRFSLGHQPFLQVVLTCLRELDLDSSSASSSSKSKDQQKSDYGGSLAMSGGVKTERDEQKENLLQSLHVQLSTFLCFTKDEKLYNYEDPTARKAMQDALQLRFSLVGGMFDAICRSQSSVIEWSTLLVQLIVRGVVDLTHNSDLFTTVLDMLAILIHSTLINDRDSGDKTSSTSDRTGNNANAGNNSSTSAVGPGSGGQTPDRSTGSGASGNVDDSRRNYSYHNLVKKLKKEIGDKSNASIKFLRQLLPLPKVGREVIVTEPFGTVNDGKGNKQKGFNSDKKQGLQVSEKQKINPWDILEGHKNPAPLSWTWFGAVKYERKPSRLEESFMELKYANFSTLEKPNSYFLEAPPLPPEDLEPPSTNRVDESKGNDGESTESGGNKPNNQMQMMQPATGGHEPHVGNANVGMQSMSNISSPRSMMAIGRGRGSLVHPGGSLGHMQNAMSSSNMQLSGQHQFAGSMPSSHHGGKPVGNIGNIPGVGGHGPMAHMQGMSRGAGLMGQRGKSGKKGKTRNIAIPPQGGPVGRGKGIPGVPIGSGQGMNTQGSGKPAIGMFSQGNNSMSRNAAGNNMMGSGQHWGSSNMAGMQGNVSGNPQFGGAPGAATGTSNYGSGTPAQPPPHYNAAIAQQQMLQSASAGSSHMSQGSRFPNAMNPAGSHNTGGPIGHSGKQALQNMLRARGPQYMNTGGSAQNVANTAPGNPAQFVSPRQGFQGPTQQASNTAMQGAAGSSGRFGSGGATSNVGPTSGMNPRLASQFGQNVGPTQGSTNSSGQYNTANYGGSSGNSTNSMQNINSYMMRSAQPGSYGSGGQVMMNRQNVMSGNMQGQPGAGGNFMSRMGQGNYMQSPNVNMGNVMQGAGYRNMGSGMPQQSAGPGNVNPQTNMMERMRMQNPQLLAQLQRGPANAPSNNPSQHLGNSFQQNRF